jgi:hypothetical protein
MVPQIYDAAGNPRTWDWMIKKYWPILIMEANPNEAGYELVALFETADAVSEASKPKAPAYILEAQEAMRERARADPEATSALIAIVLDENGVPAEGVQVAFYWPDAPKDPNTGPKYGVLPTMLPDRCVHGPTNVNGDVGFPMGGGAWVKPGEIGPHGLHGYGVDVNSGVGGGFGMKFGTNHDHMNAVFQLRVAPVPPPECPREEVLAIVEVTGQRINNVRGDLTTIGHRLDNIQADLDAVRTLMEL